jgi:hypothetical protein
MTARARVCSFPPADPLGSNPWLGLTSRCATTHAVEASPPTWPGSGSPGKNDGAMLPRPARPKQPQRRGNGLAFGAAAGPLHPAADRPLSRPPDQIPRRLPVGSRALRGPADRPAAALDPTAAAVGR